MGCISLLSFPGSPGSVSAVYQPHTASAPKSPYGGTGCTWYSPLTAGSHLPPISTSYFPITTTHYRYNGYMTFGAVLMESPSPSLFNTIMFPAGFLSLLHSLPSISPLLAASPAWLAWRLCGKPFDRSAPVRGCI